MIFKAGLFEKFVEGDIAIAVPQKSEWEYLMRLLEEHSDLRWTSDSLPTEVNEWLEYKEDSTIMCYSGKMVYTYGGDPRYLEIKRVSVEDLLVKTPDDLETKFIFIADRYKDEKVFSIGGSEHRFRDGNLEIRIFEEWEESHMTLNRVVNENVTIEPLFTDEEKIILRNVNPEYRYIARDDDGALFVYEHKPDEKVQGEGWVSRYGRCKSLEAFNHLFGSILVYDDEVVDFRKYL